MKIKSVSWREFTYKLKKPLETSNGKIEVRESIIIKLETDDAVLGFGEASPLYPFGEETFEDAKYSLRELPKLLSNYDVSDELFPFDFLADFNLSNSIRFAIEQCLTEIFIKSELQNFPNSTISVNSMVGIEEYTKSAEAIEKLISKGFSTIKIKVGKRAFDEELNNLKMIFDRYKNIRFRIDVNGAWSYEEAKINLGLLEPFNIEYVEQPCKKAEEIISLSEKVNIPIAADESFRCKEDLELFRSKGRIKHFIIKPTIIGGIANTISIINSKREDETFVISSALENIIATNYLVLLASLLPNIAHGLGTLDFIDRLLTSNNSPIKDGCIHFDSKLLLNKELKLFND